MYDKIIIKLSIWTNTNTKLQKFKICCLIILKTGIISTKYKNMQTQYIICTFKSNEREQKKQQNVRSDHQKQKIKKEWEVGEVN